MSSSKSRPHNKRALRYEWVGAERPDGQPERHLGPYDIPPRSLDAEETKALTTEQVEVINQHADLYRPIDPAPPKKASPKRRATKSVAPATSEVAEPDQPTEIDDSSAESAPADAGETGED